jgi:hypothetical protein
MYTEHATGRIELMQSGRNFLLNRLLPLRGRFFSAAFAPAYIQYLHHLQKDETTAISVTDNSSAEVPAHLDSSIRRLHSYLQYIVTVKYYKPMEALQRLQEINLE